MPSEIPECVCPALGVGADRCVAGGGGGPNGAGCEGRDVDVDVRSFAIDAG